jgi:hypothetical protein
MNKISICSLGLALLMMTAGCEKKEGGDKAELQAKVDSLQNKVDQLSAKDVVNNPNTANGTEIKADGPAPAITFTEGEHDFGTVKAGDVLKHTFKFKNTGQAPLLIESATATCGCTVPTWPKEPIAPGEEGEIPVSFDTKGKAGQQSKTITIRANTQPNVTTVTIKANVPAADNSAGPVAK